jgi:hypothetical protein
MGQRQYGKSAAKGKCAENAFDIAAKNFGWIKSREATRDENRLEHWDKLYWVDGVESKIEVKSSKRFSRFKKVQFDFVLLELHGVDRVDNHGWLFGTEAKYIAFELETVFICFEVSDILDFVWDKFKIATAYDPKIKEQAILSPTYKVSPDFPNVIPYHIYHRLNSDGNYLEDAFTWIPIEDLMKLDHFKMKK